jgi:putative PEP-CTERM system histidine kinase
VSLFFLYVPFAAAVFSLLLAGASLVRKHRSPATWCFAAGMIALAIDSVFLGFSLRATDLDGLVAWLTRAFIAKSVVPVLWLAFSLIYSRGDYREVLRRWRVPLAIVAVLSIGLSLGFRGELLQVVPAPDTQLPMLRYGAAAKIVNLVVVVAFVLTLMNLEQTFRAAIGTMRWRIKFVVIGLAVIFGARLYARSQSIVFSGPDPELAGVEASALLIGCVLLAIAYARTGLAEIDVYPSRAVLRSSITGFIVGGYLLVVGVLAQVARSMGGAESFEFQAFILLLGMAGLAVLLMSDRFRQQTHAFVVRHFGRAQHDAARIWTEFSARLASVRDQASLAAASARLVSETFGVLSVTVWLLDETRDGLAVAASTGRQADEAARGGAADIAPAATAAALRSKCSPFDLEEVGEPWAEELRQRNPTTFGQKGGNRWCVPLRAGERCLGAIVLADRVNAAPYTGEDLELLQCIGDQVTSVLLNLQLTDEVGRARELEAFRTMSAFFVHDLKNTAASLKLMLQNLPVHFDDPDFREDVLRSVGNTTRRIEEIIARLAALRQQPQLRLIETDLNRLVAEAVERLGEMPGVQVTKVFQPLPPVRVDRDQIQSVVTNLVENARDAVSGGEGRILVRTGLAGEPGLRVAQPFRAVPSVTSQVFLSVEDNGCGMSPEFVRDSLFRPFQSTKKKGLGIGMFQARMIVEKHGGSIHVESEVGKGTTVRVHLPVGDGQ